MRIVIIGAGECGIRATLALREQGFDGAIDLVHGEEHVPYERPPLSKPSADGVSLKPISGTDKVLTETCLSPLKLSHYGGANGRGWRWLGSGIRMKIV
jgi:hypothetical protein